MDEKKLLEIFGAAYTHLNGKNIYEVRNLARAFGVNAPTAERKHALILRIIGVASGVSDPEQRSHRGARVKASDASNESIAQLQKIIDECKRKLPYDFQAVEPQKSSFHDSVQEERRYGYKDEACTGIVENFGKGLWRICPQNDDTCASYPLIDEKLIREFNLREGDMVSGYVVQAQGEPPRIVQIAAIENRPPVFVERRRFEDIAAEYPTERYDLSRSENAVLRAADILCPVGKGQRVLVVAPSGTGKTVFLQEFGKAVCERAQVLCLLLGQRPEESGEYRAAVTEGLVFSEAFDSSYADRVRAARLASERAKRLAEAGKDAVLLVDSLQAYMQAAEKLSGDRDAAVLEGKKLFALARKLCGGGSLTVIATLPDAESGAERYGRGEFESAANAVFCFGREGAEKGIIPAFDFTRSYTKRCDCLLGEREKELGRRLREAAELSGTAGVLAAAEKNKE